jgi:hypothetical protein
MAIFQNMYIGLLLTIISTQALERQNSDGNYTHNNTQCTICLSTMHTPHISVLPCNHAFHGTCIMQWFIVHHTCPLCRAGMIQNSPQAPDHHELPRINISQSINYIARFAIRTGSLWLMSFILKKTVKSIEWTPQHDFLIATGLAACGIPMRQAVPALFFTTSTGLQANQETNSDVLTRIGYISGGIMLGKAWDALKPTLLESLALKGITALITPRSISNNVTSVEQLTSPSQTSNAIL